MIDLNQPRNKIILVVIAVIIVATAGVFAYLISKNLKGGKPVAPAATVPTAQDNAPKPLTPEEIQEALNKKVETSGDSAAGANAPKPLTPNEIQDALNKKVPAAEGTTDVKPLTPSEIQDALNKKAK